MTALCGLTGSRFLRLLGRTLTRSLGQVKCELGPIEYVLRTGFGFVNFPPPSLYNFPSAAGLGGNVKFEARFASAEKTDQLWNLWVTFHLSTDREL